jgi:dTDP-4-dehydrorhamnose 3,5-epimerase-like enzyme
VTRVCSGASIGANATILSGLTIGRHAVISPGAVVTHCVPPNAIVAGNPSQIIGYVNASNATRVVDVTPAHDDSASSALQVRGAALVRIPEIVDLRGSTTFAEIGRHLPFTAKRFFVVRNVPGREVRGEHAHKTLHEFLVCLAGSFSVMIDDGFFREEITMNSANVGLHVPPQVWRVVYKYTPDAVMLSLCSHVYDPADYIRNYTDFLAFVGAK